ncbi:MAG: IS66 family transposase zinc-finger binding domain-containing protein [Pseudomonadota bacterium]
MLRRSTAPVRPSQPRQTSRGSLPKRPERGAVVVDPEHFCACRAKRHVIGEDVSDQLHIISAEFRVSITRRPQYACRFCEGGGDPSSSACPDHRGRHAG